MTVATDVDSFSKKLDSLNIQSTVSEEEYKRVLDENAALVEAANEFIQSNESIRNKLSDVTAKLELLEKKFNRQVRLNAKEAEQKKLLQAQRDFRDICIEIRDGKYGHGDCGASLSGIMNRLKKIPYPFACFVYRGPYGGANWGYKCNTRNSNYQHIWKGGKCYVLFQCPPAQDRNSEFNAELHWISHRIVFKRGGDGSCIDMASDLMDHLSIRWLTPQFVLVKKEPGGYGNWAYSSTESRDAYHRWHEADDGGWFSSNTEYCVGARR